MSLDNYVSKQISNNCWIIDKTSKLGEWVSNMVINVLNQKDTPRFIYNSLKGEVPIVGIYYVDFGQETGKVAIKLDGDEIIEQDKKEAA